MRHAQAFNPLARAALLGGGSPGLTLIASVVKLRCSLLPETPAFYRQSADIELNQAYLLTQLISTSVEMVLAVGLKGTIEGGYSIRVAVLDTLIGKRRDEIVLGTKEEVRGEGDVMFVGAPDDSVPRGSGPPLLPGVEGPLEPKPSWHGTV